MSAVQRLFLALVGPLGLVALWQAAADLLHVNPLLLPTPGETFGRLWTVVSSGEINQDALATVVRWISGYAIGVAVGIPIGLAVGSSQIFYASSQFLLDFLRSLPVTALFPLFLLVFGIGDASKIAMVFTATVFVIVLNGAFGVVTAPRARADMARVFGATPAQVFRYVTIFDAAPQITIGMRTTISLSLIVVIVSEMFIGTQFGLGQRVFDSYQRNAVADLYAVLIIIGLLGYLTNRLFIAAEQRLVFWAGK